MADDRRLPAILWYFKDFMNDIKVRRCKRATRSFWHDLLGLMHEGEPYGYLQSAGKPLSISELSTLLGDPIRDVEAYLKELESFDVFSKTRLGVIYSRRMVRDAERREKQRQFGKMGGNPNLIESEVNGGLKGGVKGGLKARVIPKSYQGSNDVKTKTKRKKAVGEKKKKAYGLASPDPVNGNGSEHGPPDIVHEIQAFIRAHAPEGCDLSPGIDELKQIVRYPGIDSFRAAWFLFVNPRSKSYQFAASKRFALSEFKRQLPHLMDDPEYADLKRKLQESAI